jgi:hypothetical protein
MRYKNSFLEKNIVRNEDNTSVILQNVLHDNKISEYTAFLINRPNSYNKLLVILCL